MSREPTVLTSVAATLQRDISAQRIAADAAQMAAALRLDELSLALRNSSFTQKVLRNFGVASLFGWQASAPRGIYLCGGVGRGKTYLMDLFYATLNFPQRERTHFYRFMQDIQAGLQAAKSRTDPLDLVTRRIASRTRVLCLDEFFVSDIADAMILAGLLEGLFRRGVTLVTTSNQPPKDLYPDGLQRQRFLPAIDMLERQLEVIRVEGPVDYRLRHLESANIYLDAGLPDTELRLKRLFAVLSQGSERGPADLLIVGRKISAKDTATGAAWFDFSALCATPRSANDYIELAHLYPTIFVTHVPRLTEETDDAARRFLTLIDECYDRGVKLVISAYAAPGELYRGLRLEFDFQRAASRLIEMQSKQYLGREHRS
jgi:cell division protein ZapE